MDWMNTPEKYIEWCNPYMPTLGGYTCDERTMWTKTCTNEQYYSDIDGCSWIRTDLEHVIAVDLQYKGAGIQLISPSRSPREYWQSDDYESTVGGSTKLIRRRIQMMVDEGWITAEINSDGKVIVYLSDKRI